MSSDENQDDGAQVLDEENHIDKRLKDRILDARDRVAEAEDEIFVKAPLDPDVNRSYDELVSIWTTPVRQYLRTIEPLLRSDEIDNSHYYYRELPLLEDELYPPDGETVVLIQDGETRTTTLDIPWGLFYDDSTSTHDILWQDNTIFDPSFEPPEPKEVTLHGLKAVIEVDSLSASWTVPLNPGANFNKPTKIAKPSVTRPVGKQLLETAVREADRFLHNAGIGLEVGDPTTEAHGDYSDVVDVHAFEEE